MRARWVRAIAAVVCTLACGGGAQGDHPFRIDGDRPTRATITLTADPPAEPVCDAPMAQLIAGRLAVLERRALQPLLASAPINPQPVASIDGERTLVYVHLERGEARRTVEVVRTPRGDLIARDPADPTRPDARAKLIEGRFEALMADWPAYRGGFDERGDDGDDDAPQPPAHPPAHPIGAHQIEPPLEPSPHFLDEATINDRFYRGMRIKFDPAGRDLRDETMNVRLPAGYSPRTPAPLLVWISPTDNAIPPQSIDPVLDELGMILIGVNNTGNQRPIFDRMQLALDAVATARTRWHVDPQRVYVSGWSGGGRTSAMLWGTFSDVFTGAAPIVGLNSFYETKAGPGKVWPRAYAKPRGEALRRLREQRLAIVTGTRDFNDENTQAQARMMTRDRLAVRVFEYDMGHEVPNPQRLREVIAWMDEPARERRSQQAFEAGGVLSEYLASYPPDAPPSDQRGREMLERIVEMAPWSKAAWSAVEILGGGSK